MNDNLKKDIGELPGYKLDWIFVSRSECGTVSRWTFGQVIRDKGTYVVLWRRQYSIKEVEQQLQYNSVNKDVSYKESHLVEKNNTALKAEEELK